MALLHATTLTPSKLELLGEWMPGQPWFGGGAIVQLGSFRLDDPAGEVGIEGLILSAGDRTYHVPMTYRAAPLEGGRLVGTMVHGVLGDRWAYDATSDPVYAEALATTILTGGTQAELERDNSGTREPVEPTVTVTGSGVAGAQVEAIELRGSHLTDEGTLIETSGPHLVVIHDLEGGATTMGDHQLTGRWAGGQGQLAVARLR
ncbi:hypothetical protein GCM10022234_14490 [Aeromicrobium panaciterrae]|uniref:maltokinase N-terminal cap-like domain-containing protein n=1 Tax=Aeromicrobium panaciterrae TaxID=363861 RepID=UPI0031D4BE2C